MRNLATIITALIFGLFTTLAAEEMVNIGLNYPRTGPYSVIGLDQLRASQLAVKEINDSGGIMGKKIKLHITDSISKPAVSVKNVTDLIDNKNCEMILGGSSSGVAVAVGKVCQAKKKLFFGTLTYSNATTGSKGHRQTFRECYNAWMGAKAMGSYLQSNYKGKKYFYIIADYTWGWSTSASVRKFTGTEDEAMHKGVKVPFNPKKRANFTNALKKALNYAKLKKPDVLVVVLFGKDMVDGVKMATRMGLKSKMQLVVPNITLGMAEGGGAKVMEGVIGALPWCWNVPAKYGYTRGQAFVDKFVATYNRYPSTSGASAYTILHEYKSAVERAASFDSKKVVMALEDHDYTLLKDKQTWRAFDHQSMQSVYVVKCKKEADVNKDKLKLDYFEIIARLDGDKAVRTEAEWKAARKKAGVPEKLEEL
ncbi:MAG: substrate-binding protein [Lentisphaeraceae bacterium]|nr:substrate-binding protein [Lentisphaeraceae bacterium]